MKIEKVHVLHEDPYGPRIIDVKTTKGTVQTPERTVTSTESNYKKRVYTFAEPYMHTVFEAIGCFNQEMVKELHTKNAPFARRKRELSAHVRSYSGMITKFYPQMEMNVKLTTMDIRTLIDLQMESGVDLIAIPDISINSKVDVFEKHILDVARYVQSYSDAVPMPYLDMATEEDIFRAKVDTVWDNRGTFKVMGVIYRSPSQYRGNYSYLIEKRDRDIWVHASGVNRYYPKNWLTAQMHIPQKYGIDSYSILSRPIGGKMEQKPIEKVKRYDPKTLGIIPLWEHRQRYRNNLECNCPVCSNATLEDFIDKHVTNPHTRKKDVSLLEVWAKIHEAFASYEEFKAGRTAIKENEFKRYFTCKEYISKIIEEL